MRRQRPILTRAGLRAALVVVSVAGLVSFAGDAGAVGTRTFELDTLEKLSGGDLHGTAIASDGSVRASFTTGSTPLNGATAVFSSLVLGDGSVLLGTSPNGKILRVSGDQAEVYAETKSLAVTSMIAGPSGSGVVYAATMPEGKIYKVTKGKADVLVTLPDTSNVWALSPAKNGGFYAATGADGKIFRVGADGQTSTYFTSEDGNVISLATADDGTLYAGTGSKGLLYRITGPGRGGVLYDFPGDDVKAIAIGPGGSVYAIANEYPEPPELGSHRPGGRSAPSPVATAHPKPGKGSLYRFDAQGRPERLMHHDEFHYSSLALDSDGRAHVGTGADGRVYSVDDAHVVTLEFDGDERQVGALALPGTAKSGFFAGSDPAVFHRIVAHGGGDAIWTSKALDAGLRARFGHLSFRSSGPLEISTRTGDTQVPDESWSAWSGAVGQGGAITSPPGRFLQVRGRWSRDPGAILSDVTIPFETENLRPIVTEVSAVAKSALVREPIGSGKEIPTSGGEVPKHDPVVKVSWKTDNADNDTLRYRVAVRREGQTLWRDLLRTDEVLTKPEYEWDTTAMPEGLYKVRVEASDEPANPPADVQTHQLESSPVRIDNTPPVISGVTLSAGAGNVRTLTAHVTDGLGPIVRVEMAIDGHLEWHPLAAADGLFDTADERVDANVASLLPPGPHLVTVRAVDAAGNSSLAEAESR
jgi:hypothetical protein